MSGPTVSIVMSSAVDERNRPTPENDMISRKTIIDDFLSGVQVIRDLGQRRQQALHS